MRPNCPGFRRFSQTQGYLAIAIQDHFSPQYLPEAVADKTMHGATLLFRIRPEPGPADRRTAFDAFTWLVIGRFTEKHQVVLIGRLKRQYLAAIDRDYCPGFGIVDHDKGQSSCAFDEFDMPLDTVVYVQLFYIHIIGYPLSG